MTTVGEGKGAKKTVRYAVSVAMGLALAAAAHAEISTPFKLGSFASGERSFVGLVIGDTRVIDIARANAAYQRAHPKAAKVRIPADMKGVIEAYDGAVGTRLRTIANSSGTGSAYQRSLVSLKILPPVMPAVILNAGANYPEHLAGIETQGGRGGGSENISDSAAPRPPAGRPAGPPGPPRPAQSAPGIWERPAGDNRPDNPYFFLKSPSVVVGANDDVIIPQGRVNIDWECEFAVVVGKTSHHVATKDAPAYIFGYSIEFDVSDRGGRGDRKMGGAPDWLVQKNHDTFAPIGPFIVPKEFVKTPMNTRHFFTLNGEIKQDSNTSRMEYNIWEGLAFASNVMTLHPGDMISMGTPPGTNIDRPDARWLRAGDVGVCTVEGIGSQRHNMVAEK